MSSAVSGDWFIFDIDGLPSAVFTNAQEDHVHIARIFLNYLAFGRHPAAQLGG
jgi:hypothetical protein